MHFPEAGCRSALARQNAGQRWPCGLKDRFGCPFLWFFLTFIPPTGGRQAKETNKPEFREQNKKTENVVFQA